MAGNNIKGLTVEIGGDTTKLGKALEDVNKKSKDLSSELGQINKLLKLDPGNADLLAQKQKVLADAVGNTKEKLDKLKEAEKQVQQQFEKGEVSEEQVRALQREIVATTKKLEGYEKAAKETADEVKNLGKKSDDTGKGLKDTKKGADKASDSLDDMARSADKAGDASDGLGSKLGGLAKGGFKALAAGVSALVGALGASAEVTREYRTEMGKLDTAFTTNGHSSETAQKTYKSLQGVLGETDQAVEAANHLAKLTKNEKDLEKWTDICTGVYATFGASLPIEGLTEAANETAKTGALTGALADALNWAGVNEEAFQAQLDACSSEQERQALITETLNGLYSDAADAYKKTNAEIIRANEANEAWTASMAEVGGVVEPILTDVKLLGASLLSDLVPGVKEVATAFRGVLNGEAGAAEGLGSSLSGLIMELVNKVTELAPTAISVALSLITTLTTTLLGQLPTITSTIMQILEQAVLSLGTALPSLLRSVIDSAFGILTNFAAYAPDVLSALASFMGVLSAELPRIAEQIASWIPELVTSISDTLVISTPLLLEAAVQLLLSVVQALPSVASALAVELPTLVLTAADMLTQGIPVLLNGALQLFSAVLSAIPLLLESLLPEIPTIVSAVVSALVENTPVLTEGALQLLSAILSALPLLIELLLPEIPTIATTVVNGLLSALPVLLDAAVALFMAIIEAIPLICELLWQEAPLILDTILQVLGELPRLLWGILESVLISIGVWDADMAANAKEAAKNFINNVVNFIKELPSKIWTWLQNTVSKISQFGSNAVTKAKTAAKNILDAIVNGVKTLPEKIKQVGTDLVKGLWNGINDMVGWVTGKIQSFGSGILDGIKNFFGIKSPSRVFRDEVGKMLAVGMAEGIEKNADAPLDAMTELSKGIMDEAGNMNGLTFERRLQHTFAAPEIFSGAETGMLNKLDKILSAIERGQILTLDGKALVGATAETTDAVLGQRRALVARGAM